MAATAAILTIAKTGLDYMQSQRQASAASAQGRYAKTVDDQNAAISDAQAKDATERGTVEEGRQRLATRQNVGASRAALAAQGVDISSGSAADVQSSEAALGELDALTIRNNAAREAWGYKVEAIQQRKSGQQAELAGDNAAAGYRAEGYSTLLTGGLNTYGIYQRSQANKADLRTSPNRPGGK